MWLHHVELILVYLITSLCWEKNIVKTNIYIADFFKTFKCIYGLKLPQRKVVVVSRLIWASGVVSMGNGHDILPTGLLSLVPLLIIQSISLHSLSPLEIKETHVAVCNPFRF